MVFCLSKPVADVLKNRFVNGEITPQALIDMGNVGRRKYFKEFMGDLQAKEVNTLFESKLVLKDIEAGIVRWASKMISAEPATRKSITDKVNSMKDILKPEDINNYLDDLVNKRLGLEVSMDQSGIILENAQRVKAAETAYEENPNEETRMEMGRAKVDFHNYFNGLKMEETKRTWKEWLKDPLDSALQASGATKAMRASFDNSSLLRQGWRTFTSHPVLWAKNAANSFLNIYNTVVDHAGIDSVKSEYNRLRDQDKGRIVSGAKTFYEISKAYADETVMNEVMADLITRPNAELYRKHKLAVGNVEEMYPESFLGKLPLGVGRLYKASEVAFTAFIQQTRADIFDKYLTMAEKGGVDITDTNFLDGVSRVVNSMTGRGYSKNIGGDAGKYINNLLFSPKWIKSQIDFLSTPVRVLNIYSGTDWWVRKRETINFIKTTAVSAGILMLADQIGQAFGYDDVVEWDPTSSDFGKIRIENRRFDVTGGAGSMIVFAARQWTGKSKSSVSGNVTELNSGDYGSKTKLDVLYEFLQNKASPSTGVVINYLRGTDFKGDKIPLWQDILSLGLPISVGNLFEEYGDEALGLSIAGFLADGIGLSSSSYSSEVKTDAEKWDIKLQDMAPEDAKAKMIEIKADNEVLHKQILEVREQRKLEYTNEDRMIKELGVSNYEKAMYVWDEMQRLSPESRTEYYDDLVKRKIVQESVKEQIDHFIKEGKPVKKDGTEVLVLEEEDEDAGFVKDIKNYYKAVQVNPVEAWNVAWSKEKLESVHGDTLLKERLIDEAESERIKTERGYTTVSERSKVKVDHTIPKALGGDNSDENLVVVSKEMWESYTPVEMYLIDLFQTDKMTGERARELITKFKNKEMTADEVYSASY